MQHHAQPDPLATDSFPTDPLGLSEAGRPPLVELAGGDTRELGLARWPSGWAVPRCGCWALTGRPRGRPYRCSC